LVTPSASHSLLSRHYPPNFCPEREAKDSNMTEELSLVQTKYVKRKKERKKERRKEGRKELTTPLMPNLHI